MNTETGEIISSEEKMKRQATALEESLKGNNKPMEELLKFKGIPKCFLEKANSMNRKQRRKWYRQNRRLIEGALEKEEFEERMKKAEEQK